MPTWGFAYAPGNPVLQAFNMTIAGGETVALVGASGAGKSTLSKLLFRFYDPTEGAVAIDGTNIRSVSLDSVRRAIAVVPQDRVLFNDFRYARTFAMASPAQPMRRWRRPSRPPT